MGGIIGGVVVTPFIGGVIVGVVRGAGPKASLLGILGRTSAKGVLLTAGSCAGIYALVASEVMDTEGFSRAAYDSEVADTLRRQRHGQGAPLFRRDDAGRPLGVEELADELKRREAGEPATEPFHRPPPPRHVAMVDLAARYAVGVGAVGVCVGVGAPLASLGFTAGAAVRRGGVRAFARGSV